MENAQILTIMCANLVTNHPHTTHYFASEAEPVTMVVLGGGGLVEAHLAHPHHHHPLAEEVVVEEEDVAAEGHIGVTVVKHLVAVW